MIDVSQETLLKVTEAAKAIPTRPSVATVWRWLAKGSRGVRLESVLIGGSRYTSKEAIGRFFEAVTRAGEPEGPAMPSATPRQRAAAISRAQRELDAAGL